MQWARDQWNHFVSISGIRIPLFIQSADPSASVADASVRPLSHEGFAFHNSGVTVGRSVGRVAAVTTASPTDRPCRRGGSGGGGGTVTYCRDRAAVKTRGGERERASNVFRPRSPSFAFVVSARNDLSRGLIGPHFSPGRPRPPGPRETRPPPRPA